MKNILQGWGLIAGFIKLAILLVATGANAEDYAEGVHYERLPVQVGSANPSRIEVVEVFSYACIHCKNFDPSLEQWVRTLSDDVAFSRTPAIFNQTWATLAQAYYTAEVLGVGHMVHTAMFSAIHDLGVDLRRPDLLARLFEREAGVSRKLFDQTFSSFGVRNLVQQAEARGRAYRISGVPSLVIGGRFRIDARMAGTTEGMLGVASYLIQVIQRELSDAAMLTPAEVLP